MQSIYVDNLKEMCSNHTAQLFTTQFYLKESPLKKIANIPTHTPRWQLLSVYPSRQSLIPFEEG
jgi:hypothetical protein